MRADDENAYRKKSKWMAIMAQLAATYGLSRSPIRLSFHKKPLKPDLPLNPRSYVYQGNIAAVCERCFGTD